MLERFAPGRTISASTTIDELGLSSLERVELMMALEETFEVDGGRKRLQRGSDRCGPGSAGCPSGVGPGIPGIRADGGPGETRELTFPWWNRTLPARIARRVSLPTWILPLSRIWARMTVTGLEHLESIDGPVIFAANHQSHFDGPVILDSLPPKWRYRTAPSMMRGFFDAHFFPERHTRKQWFTNSLNYYLSSLFFNVFPLSQGGAARARRCVTSASSSARVTQY